MTCPQEEKKGHFNFCNTYTPYYIDLMSRRDHKQFIGVHGHIHNTAELYNVTLKVRIFQPSLLRDE